MHSDAAGWHFKAKGWSSRNLFFGSFVIAIGLFLLARNV